MALPPAPRIADMGTGTARFLLRVHPMHPGASLEGFDISSTFFPPENTLPPNTSLAVSDIKQPFPEEMHGKYDLVHARMLITAILPEEWGSVVRNLVTLLRPGGFIQWEECEFLNAEYLASRPGARLEKTRYVGDLFRAAQWERFKKGWNTLPQEMRDAGLTAVVSEAVPSDRDPETRESITTSILSLCFTWARMMRERGAPGAMSADELDVLQREVADEIRSGCYFKYNIHIACGRKPLEQEKLP